MPACAVAAIPRGPMPMRWLHRLWRCCLPALAALLVCAGAGAADLVDAGRLLYRTGVGYAGSGACSGCHFGNLPPNTTHNSYSAPANPSYQNHPNAANNPALVTGAFAAGGGMSNFGYTAAVPAADAFKLALFIGQYKAPSFKSAADGSCPDPTLAMKTVAGTAVTKDIFGCLRTDGSSGVAQTGGFTIASSPANGTATATEADAPAGDALAYNLRYTPAPGFVGTDALGIRLVNPINAPAGLTRSNIPVTVFGFTSGLAASGRVGQAGATVYTIDSNDPSATFAASVIAAPPGGAGTLAGLGLAVGARTVDGAGAHAPISGNIPASAVPGQYTVRVSATINGVSPAVLLTQDITLTLAGITSSAAPPAIAQNGSTQTSYAITSFPAATAGSFTLASNPPGPLPPWISLNATSGIVTISPTTSGSFNFTIGATTGAPAFAVTQPLAFTITAATAPTITTTMPESPTAAGTVGTPLNWAIVASTPPPIDAGSYTLSAIGANPVNPGLVVDAQTGAITGTPNASGLFALRLGATNSGGSGVGTRDVTILINPSSAPVVSPATPPDGHVGTAFAAFAVSASNPPITAYAVAPGSSLPDGLALNPTTGAITGTPSGSGSFATRFTATNSVGTSAPVELAFNIIANAKPVVTGPTFASFPAGVAIAPLQVQATNPVITGYRATGLPPGLQLDGATGVISGTPTTPGSFTVKLAADNGAPGAPFGADRDVPFTIGVPAPSACTMSVPLNTATTLDLATCLFGGFAPTGVSIVATPAHGEVAVSGTRVTYTPRQNYFGADSFTFVGSGLGGNSPQGTVTVTVTGRPDPTQDATVAALVAAQAETAQRFARTQIANFQRRMEALHRGPADAGTGGARLQALPAMPSMPSLGGLGDGLAGRVGGAVPGAAPDLRSGLLVHADGSVAPQSAGAITALAASHAPAAAGASEVLRALSAGLGAQSLPLAENLVALARTKSLNLSGVASGLGLNTAPPRSGAASFWVEGVASFGTRDAAGGQVGSRFESDGVTMGADWRLSERLALGLGLGYARDRTLIGSDGSISRARGYSMAVYGSYQPSAATFLDAMLGVGTLDFDSSRYVAPIAAFAGGRRSGSQLFGSLAGGYEMRTGNLTWSPYGRIDFSTDRLNRSTESGAGAYALQYQRQTSTSVQGAIGLRAESLHALDFGYAVPRLRVEYRHAFKRSGDAYVRYADQIGGPLYRLAAGGDARNLLVLGLGSDFILRDGLSLGFEYQLSHSFANASTHALRLRLSKDFDVRGLPRLASEDGSAAPDVPLNLQVEGGAVYDDNVTRAKSGADRLGDHFYTLNVSRQVRQGLSENSRLLWTASVGGEKFRRFNGLSRATLGGEVEFQYRASSEFDEPTYGAFARLAADAFESRLRDGYSLALGVSLRQALTDRISAFAALSHNLRNASSQVFSTRDHALRGNLDYALSERQILYLGAEVRYGDIVSTGRPSLENVTVADLFTQDDAYPGGQRFAYRFRGHTALLTLGYNLALGPRDSIDFSWRHVRSTPGLRPGFVSTPRSYNANQLSAVYLMRF